MDNLAHFKKHVKRKNIAKRTIHHGLPTLKNIAKKKKTWAAQLCQTFCQHKNKMGYLVKHLPNTKTTRLSNLIMSVKHLH